jgi:hypothetical protein
MVLRARLQKVQEEGVEREDTLSPTRQAVVIRVPGLWLTERHTACCTHHGYLLAHDQPTRITSFDSRIRRPTPTAPERVPIARGMGLRAAHAIPRREDV